MDPTAAAEPDHDLGRREGSPGPVGRRRALGLLGLGALALAGCGGGSGDSSAGDPTTSTTPGAGRAGDDGSGDGEIPDETAGPYPADGSNGPDALAEPGVVRRDIRSSFGASTTTAEGVPITYDLTVTEAGTGAPLAGAAVYLWHCDREGRYSMYSAGVEDENYLRGVQEAGADGKVTFTSVVPGAYPGRWPHVHFAAYPSLDAATTGGEPLKTSQLALPEDVCDAAYASDGYEASVTTMGQTSLDGDMVFADGVDDQMATVTGSVASGYVAALTVPV